MATATFPVVSPVVIGHGEQERTRQDGALTARGLQQATAAAAAVSLTAGDRIEADCSISLQPDSPDMKPVFVGSAPAGERSRQHLA
jgi:hypothetical protein